MPLSLYARQYGDAGPPLVILHGLLGAGGNWHTLASRAFSPHFQVFAVDQRNHGRSPHSEEMSYAAMADDLHHFLEENGLSSTYLLGHSMGGKTAMQFALSYPERVEKLVVADIAPKPYPPQHMPLIEALRGLDLAAYGTRGEIDEALRPQVPSWPVRQFLLKNLTYDKDAGGYAWLPNLDVLAARYDEVNVGLDGISDGDTFDGPTLFIRGGRSDYVSDDDLDGIHRHFPNAELATLPEAGHWLHAEQPEAFARRVLDFLLT